MEDGTQGYYVYALREAVTRRRWFLGLAFLLFREFVVSGLALLADPATINIKCLPSDVARIIGGEKGCGAANLTRLARTA